MADNPSLLIMGGYHKLGGGGIRTFVLEQEKYLTDDFKVTKCNQTATYLDSFILSLILTTWKFLKFPFRDKPDIVHINTTAGLGFYRDSIYILFISFVWRTPIALRTGGSGFDEFITTDSKIKQGYLRLIFSRVDVLFPLTQLQANVLSRYGSENKISILRQATEVSNYSPVWNTDTTDILFLSSLSDRKGFPEFAETIRNLLTDSNIDSNQLSVDIAGDGEYEQLAQSLEDKFDAVTYHGYVSGQAKFDLFNNASIFVLPTHAEGFPNTIIEAMAGGNAIVATNVSGIPELVGESNGIIIEPGVPLQLEQALKLLIDSPDKIQEMGELNHEVVKQNYTWNKTRKQLVGVYSELVPSK